MGPHHQRSVHLMTCVVKHDCVSLSAFGLTTSVVQVPCCFFLWGCCHFSPWFAKNSYIHRYYLFECVTKVVCFMVFCPRAGFWDVGTGSLHWENMFRVTVGAFLLNPTEKPSLMEEVSSKLWLNNWLQARTIGPCGLRGPESLAERWKGAFSVFFYFWCWNF